MAITPSYLPNLSDGLGHRKTSTECSQHLYVQGPNTQNGINTSQERKRWPTWGCIRNWNTMSKIRNKPLLHNMDESHRYYAEWKKPDTWKRMFCWFHLWEFQGQAKFICGRQWWLSLGGHIDWESAWTNVIGCLIPIGVVVIHTHTHTHTRTQGMIDR